MVRGVPAAAALGASSSIEQGQTHPWLWFRREADAPPDTPFEPCPPVDYAGLRPPKLSAERAALARADPSVLSSTAGAAVHVNALIDELAASNGCRRMLTSADVGMVLRASLPRATVSSVASLACATQHGAVSPPSLCVRHPCTPTLLHQLRRHHRTYVPARPCCYHPRPSRRSARRFLTLPPQCRHGSLSSTDTPKSGLVL